MWLVKSIEVREAELDFSSSGQGKAQVRQLWFDGLIFANAVGFTSWSDDPFQVTICDQCGIEGCASGGYLAARRAGDFLVFAPAVDEMNTEDPSWEQWVPPDFMVNQGAPVLDLEARASLARLVPVFSNLSEFKPLTLAEAVKILQFEAPARALGIWREPPRIDDDLVIASDAGDLRDGLREIESILARAASHPDLPCVLRVLSPEDEEVTLFLDHPGEYEWKPFVVARGAACLRVDPGLVLEVGP